MGQIPEEFRPVFWDTSFDKLDLTKNASFIITRMYVKGGYKGIHWVNETYTEKEIAEAAKKRRDLNPIVANYLKKKCGLDENEMAYYRIQKTAVPWR